MPIRMHFEAEAAGSIDDAIRDLVAVTKRLGVGGCMMVNGTTVWADPRDDYADVLARFRTMDEAKRTARQRSTALRDEAALRGKIENW
jgi:hypothetical protein